MSYEDIRQGWDRTLLSLFTQITDKAFMSKLLEDKDCNTCRHHAQTTTDYPACDDCLRTPSLMYWEPIVSEEKECDTCKHEHVSGLEPPCHTCRGQGADCNWEPKEPTQVTSDGSTASYYELPEGATELQDLIAHRNMNAQVGEIFRACYRLGQCSHSPRLRDMKKVKFYAEAEIARLEKYGDS